MNGKGTVGQTIAKLRDQRIDGYTGENDQKTDLKRWRLKDDHGVQTWVYLKTKQEVADWPQSIADRHHLGLKLVRL